MAATGGVMSAKELRYTDRSGFVVKGGTRTFSLFTPIEPRRV
jgi:hypothetical protein